MDGRQIIDHNDKEYREIWARLGQGRYNGAFYYSKEIVKNIIPNVETWRPWVTVKTGRAFDHAIVFIHNNLDTERYKYLEQYSDLVLVCGIPETCEKVAHLGKAIYLPLSIDLEYIEQFQRPRAEQKGVAYIGRRAKLSIDGVQLPPDVPCIWNIKRQEMLKKMAGLAEVYAVGRTAVEATALGVKVLPFDSRYPDPSIWQPVDNKEAAIMLQTMLNIIDA